MRWKAEDRYIGQDRVTSRTRNLKYILNELGWRHRRLGKAAIPVTRGENYGLVPDRFNNPDECFDNAIKLINDLQKEGRPIAFCKEY